MGSINNVNIGVIGYGYWGPNLVRNFSELSGANVRTVSDFSPELLAKAKARYPAIQITTDCNDIFNDPEIDAVAIATPVSTHFKLALAALQSGKHVMVEKPMTMTSEQSIELLAEAKRQNRILMVDHTFVYTGAVRKMAELVSSKELGDIYYYDSAILRTKLESNSAVSTKVWESRMRFNQSRIQI